ncbi:hypothetical protein QM716_28390 [Rhodococcus sp. IEGM 1409]|uniref:hypothetical protein n=1 Tax=Rhodococcus sp. IEGM 1409 TaxID=3047082 RepID=UPI0024B64E22|nr:hypothetical protein [Rhodococcus sp. IEGM 1409]MDI9903789.1 hypothetical protein [Rhodococcus sp. IEGM 1409]
MTSQPPTAGTDRLLIDKTGLYERPGDSRLALVDPVSPDGLPDRGEPGSAPVFSPWIDLDDFRVKLDLADDARSDDRWRRLWFGEWTAPDEPAEQLPRR